MASSNTASPQGLGRQSPEPPPEPERGNVTLTELLPGDKLYDGIKYDCEQAGLRVDSVERLENHNNWDQYTNERDRLQKNRLELDPTFNLNEKYLYHGTNLNKALFAEEGEEIDHRLSKGGCFGTGIYFSDNPKKCIKYAARGTEDNLILLMRVVLGESKVYPKGKQDRTLNREPKKENPGRGNRFYDSVEGQPTQFREFVIYEKRRALIECIITFTKVDKKEVSSDQETCPQPVLVTPSGDAPSPAASQAPDDDTDSSDDEEPASNTHPDDDTSSSDEYADPDSGDENVEFTDDEEAEMERVAQGLESQLTGRCSTPEGMENLNAEDKEAILSELIEQFCQVVGLDKSVACNSDFARTCLSKTNWEIDVALIAYYEDTYGI